ncbi:unnamed protein product, partial [Heterotrigona itama]
YLMGIIIINSYFELAHKYFLNTSTYNEWNNKNDATPHPNHTHICGKYVSFYKITNYGHRVQCLSPSQVAPGHLSGILTMNTEEIKPENPKLKK